MIVGGVVAVGLVGALGYLGWSKVAGGSAMPLTLSQLPDNTSLISRESAAAGIASRFVLEKGDVPKEAIYSDVAEAFCPDAPDVFAALMAGRGAGPNADDLAAVRAGLNCGKIWGKKGLTLHFVKFRKGEQDLRVRMGSEPPSPFPESRGLKTAKDPEGFKDSVCLVDLDKEEAEKDKLCEGKKHLARFEKQKVFAMGSFADLDAFGKAFSAEGKNKLDHLQDVERLLGGLYKDNGSVMTGKNLELVLLPPAEDKEIAEKVEKLIKGADAASTSADEDGGTVRQRYEFAMASESEAQELSTALEKYLRSAKAKAKDFGAKEKEELDKQKDSKDDEKLSKPLREQKRLGIAWRRARLRMTPRALEAAKPEPKGKSVVLTITYEPDTDDKEAWSALRTFNKERAKAVAEVLAEIIDGKDPSKEKLKELGQEALDPFYPPDYAEVEGVDGKITVPGAKCSKGILGSTCIDKKQTNKEEALTKLSEKLTADGFTVEKLGDAVLGTKGTGKLRISVETDEKKGTVYKLEKSYL
ncbi:MAG: hypothetical protein FJ096_07585 [Deltaproteobacteria bacterium]|nr:hypothetical protein [Deltaproteobacteria bacterium]